MKPDMVLVHPRDYQRMRNLSTTLVELGPRAARAWWGDSMFMATASLIAGDWERWERSWSR